MEDIIEVWKSIAGYEGLYEVSNCGRIKSFDRWIDNRYGYGEKILRPGRFLKPEKNNLGYFRATLYKDKKKERILVHRLVAEAFLPNPDGLPVVNHKDENPSNNFVYVNPDGTVDPQKSNLEWCTVQYNTAYLGHMKRWGEKMLNRSDLSKPIIQLSKDGTFVKRWNSIMEAARSGIASKQNIMRVLKKKGGSITAAGFRWIYESEYI